jgi:hypothetical protein
MKSFMASVKLAYEHMVKLIVPAIVDAHRIFRAYITATKLERRPADLKERRHNPNV